MSPPKPYRRAQKGSHQTVSGLNGVQTCRKHANEAVDHAYGNLSGQ